MSCDNFDQTGIFVVEPTSKHTHSFVLLHGPGSDGKKFGQKLLDTGISSDGRKLNEIFPGARFVFPTAEERESNAFPRLKLALWFDLESFSSPWRYTDTQLEGLEESAAEIMASINVEIRQVPANNVIIGGWSLGCAAALSYLLTRESRLGGFIGMSGWLPLQPDIQKKLKPSKELVDISNPFGPDDDVSYITEADPPKVDPSETKTVYSDSDTDRSDPEDEWSYNDNSVNVIRLYRDLIGDDSRDVKNRDFTSITTPVFLGHGDSDEKIDCSYGENASIALESLGYDVTWKKYKGQGHGYKIPDEIDDIVEFVQQKVGWGQKNS
ncbi:acyl-protein thioesterase [Hypomontagnella monticulosa]|nr:acyl-protein thioesterase [Hypomontagnella monticulosa]